MGSGTTGRVMQAGEGPEMEMGAGGERSGAARSDKTGEEPEIKRELEGWDRGTEQRKMI